MTNTVQRVERACQHLADTDQPVTFTAIATATGISRATLYRNPELRTVINDYRTHQSEGRTLTGLHREIAHLRTALTAIASTSGNHEERLRQLENRRRSAPQATGTTPD